MPVPSDDDLHLREALRLATESAGSGGGPFGAVIVKNGQVIARGTNGVVSGCDPTAHAEVTAIRAACESLGTHLLAGCTLYSSCEPCPMCLGAIYWSRLERLVFAGGRDDAAAAGFDDARLYDELPLPAGERSLATERRLADEGRGPFEAWARFSDRVPY
ncbi:nucleoside deaminase [Engelhardtia mirabilis]|uniref:Guanine deaminase n=1 Tax=Engelhardtia mirabilis TaxID=2528011 RepID=A0A518BG92_9BACT|nr:Guanine deaminase [Planctomycetes bacterium Pla133]QDV00335.1 Guanine deaminase [Planctomycetes bacterium Pla86]